ncbi:hypothetical protein [Vibrio rumoiensis]|uniref:Lipoprotein n=1 Tax=Vibrio rumoiensis TaxID=76258 RepID=A0ABW7IW38_9VIBR
MRFSVKKSVVLCAAVFAASGLTGCNSDSNDKSSNDSDIVILDELYAGKDPSTVDDDAVVGETYTFDSGVPFFKAIDQTDVDELNVAIAILGKVTQPYDLESDKLRTNLRARVRCGNDSVTQVVEHIQPDGQGDYTFADHLIDDGNGGYATIINKPSYQDTNARWKVGQPESGIKGEWTYSPEILAVPQTKQALYQETMDTAFATFQQINQTYKNETAQTVVDTLSGNIDENVSDVNALIVGSESDVDVIFELNGLKKIEHPVGYDDVQYVTVGSKIGVYELRGSHNTCEYSLAILSGSNYAADIIYKTLEIQGTYQPEDEMTDDMY